MSDLRLATSKLNHVAYLRYKLCQSRSPEYFIWKIVDATTNEVVICGQSLRHPDAPPRKFTLDVTSMYIFKDMIAEQDMCVHEVVAKCVFTPQLFVERHFQRKRVSGSRNGWIAPPKQNVDEIIGFCPEGLKVTSHTPAIESMNEMNAVVVFNPFS